MKINMKLSIKDIFVRTAVRILATALVVISLLSFSATVSYAESENALLAQYYAALAAQGGNDEMTAEEAQAYAEYYAALAAAEGSSSKNANKSSQGTIVQVVNQGASDEFWQQMVGQVNSMPESIKKLMNKYKVIYYCVKDGSYFGIPGASGVTSSTWIKYGSGKRKITMVIYLAEHSNNNETLHTIYHETGHALDQIHWKETGLQFCKTNEFQAAMQGELEPMYSLYRQRNMNSNLEEYYADGFATFFVHNAEMAAVCPKMYAYFIATIPQ